jgi:hypothetical protein
MDTRTKKRPGYIGKVNAQPMKKSKGTYIGKQTEKENLEITVLHNGSPTVSGSISIH